MFWIFGEMEGRRKIWGFTNWTPVSLRMPTPAEAKLAPMRRFSPSSRGLRYGRVGCDPSFSPAMIFRNRVSQ